MTSALDGGERSLQTLAQRWNSLYWHDAVLNLVFLWQLNNNFVVGGETQALHEGARTE
jgi:hypothetical protein